MYGLRFFTECGSCRGKRQRGWRKHSWRSRGAATHSTGQAIAVAGSSAAAAVGGSREISPRTQASRKLISEALLAARVLCRVFATAADDKARGCSNALLSHVGCCNESAAACKRRLHLTAVRLPKQLVADVEAIYQNNGGRTKLD